MKKKFKSHGAVVFVIFVFAFAILFNHLIYEKIKEVHGRLNYNKVTLQMKDDVKLEQGISVNEAEKIKNNLSSTLVTYYAMDEADISFQKDTVKCKIYGVSGRYNAFYNLPLKSGSFLNQSDDDEKRYVAVIEEKLARKLFKTDNVIGMNINIYHHEFTVIGVKKENKSPLATIFEEDFLRVYIPLNTMTELRALDTITNVEVETLENTLPEKNKAQLKDQLDIINKNSNDYYISDYSALGQSIKQRTSLIIFSVGVYLIYRLLKAIKHVIKNIVSHVGQELKSNYLFAAIKKTAFTACIECVKIGLMIACVIFLWNQVTFQLYISPENFPQNPMRLSQISAIVKTNVQHFFNIDHLHMIPEVKMTQLLQKISTIIFCIAAYAGIRLVIFRLIVIDSKETA